MRRTQQGIFGHFTNITTCPQCSGRGTIITNPCRQCNGTGREQKLHKISVKIPGGLDDGNTIRITGEGNRGFGGGPPGNLLVSISVMPHGVLYRDGEDIVYDLPLNFAQAALGGEVDVPTLEGDHAIKIPAGVQSGRTIRLKGKGAAHLRRSGRGDQIVIVHVVSPTQLDKEQKQLFRKLAEIMEPAVLPDEDKGFFGRMKGPFGSR